MTPAAASPAPQAAFTPSSPSSSTHGSQASGSASATGTAATTGPPGAANGPPAPFASVLHDHVARTAHAEGQKKTGDDPASGHRAREKASDPNADGTAGVPTDG